MADLKAAVYALLQRGPQPGMRNADIGRALGIHAGHVEHEGHIPRTLLALMEKEGVVQQDPHTKLWSLRLQVESEGEAARA
jgi:DNA-binding IclR family transcriptional regulator